MYKEVLESKEQTLHANFFCARVQGTMRQILNYCGDYSHALHNDGLVSDRPHIRRWSLKIIL
jgi:hypothetical protein